MEAAAVNPHCLSECLGLMSKAAKRDSFQKNPVAMGGLEKKTAADQPQVSTSMFLLSDNSRAGSASGPFGRSAFSPSDFPYYASPSRDNVDVAKCTRPLTKTRGEGKGRKREERSDAEAVRAAKAELFRGEEVESESTGRTVSVIRREAHSNAGDESAGPSQSISPPDGYRNARADLEDTSTGEPKTRCIR